MMNKKGMAQILLVVSILAGLITILGAAGLIDTASITGSGSYIQRPVFYYDKCEAVGSYSYSQEYSILKNGQWLSKPSSTDEYDVLISTEDFFDIGQRRIEYYVCNSRVLSDSNCRLGNPDGSGGILKTINSQGTYTITDIRPNEYVWLQYQDGLFYWKGSDKGNYQIGFQPFGLRQYNVLSGSSNQVNPNSCSYPLSQDISDTIISENLNGISSPSNAVTNERNLQPNEVRWYVAGYVSSAEPSIMLKYDNKDAWCRTTGTTGEIYAINEIKTIGGTYKVASADYSDYLGSVNCCPGQVNGDYVCNDNFRYEKVQGSECSAFRSCGSANWVPYSSNEIIRYACVDGFCESETKGVKCASNSDCSDSNKICDLNNFKCVDADVNLKGDIIKTIPDTQNECIKEGGEWITQEDEKQTLGSLLGFREPQIITTEYCKMPTGINWVLWIGIFAVVILLIFIMPKLFPLIKISLAKAGIRW